MTFAPPPGTATCTPCSTSPGARINSQPSERRAGELMWPSPSRWAPACRPDGGPDRGPGERRLRRRQQRRVCRQGHRLYPGQHRCLGIAVRHAGAISLEPDGVLARHVICICKRGIGTNNSVIAGGDPAQGAPPLPTLKRIGRGAALAAPLFFVLTLWGCKGEATPQAPVPTAGVAPAAASGASTGNHPPVVRSARIFPSK